MRGPDRALDPLPTTLFAVMLWAQGLYYLLTAVWPIVHIDSFLAVTGPKTDHETTALGDHWLLTTVAVLIAAVGLTLLFAAWRRRFTPEVVFLAVAAAVGLTGIDVVYVARGAIPPVYLLDAVAEVLLLAGWAVTGLAARTAWRRSPEIPAAQGFRP